MSDKEIKVPNIGEFKNVEVIEVLVSNGQSVSKNDPLITIESDKSSVEIPSSFEGKVKSVNIKVGDKVSEGDTILIIENNGEVKVDIEEQLKIEKEEEETQTKKETIVNDKPEKNFIEKNISGISAASPKARKFARELGVDINEIHGSQRQGRVVESDVKNFISSKINKPTEAKETKTKKN
jgi:pyruvate dehydrogenase E2 component (dihydrolipoamide acetyltransferase)